MESKARELSRHVLPPTLLTNMTFQDTLDVRGPQKVSEFDKRTDATDLAVLFSQVGCAISISVCT